jgi:hypothetical protein
MKKSVESRENAGQFRTRRLGVLELYPWAKKMTEKVSKESRDITRFKVSTIYSNDHPELLSIRFPKGIRRDLERPKSASI